MPKEEIKANLLDYIDPEKFWKDYIQDNHCIVPNLSDTQYDFLKANKVTVMLHARYAYRLYKDMSECECVETACNAVLRFMPENESLDSILIKWLSECHSHSVLNAKHSGLAKLPTCQGLNDSDKAAFGKWLMERYSKEYSRKRALNVLIDIRFFKVKNLQIPDDAACELIDRVAAYIDSKNTPKDSVAYVLKDWCDDKISNPVVNLWIKHWVYNRLIELKKQRKVKL